MVCPKSHRRTGTPVMSSHLSPRPNHQHFPPAWSRSPPYFCPPTLTHPAGLFTCSQKDLVIKPKSTHILPPNSPTVPVPSESKRSLYCGPQSRHSQLPASLSGLIPPTLQLSWAPPSSSNMPGTLLPQGLRTCSSLCLDRSFPGDPHDLTSFVSLLKCHLLSEVFPVHSIFS